MRGADHGDEHAGGEAQQGGGRGDDQGGRHRRGRQGRLHLNLQYIDVPTFYL